MKTANPLICNRLRTPAEKHWDVVGRTAYFAARDHAVSAC
jgi:hypothetical protein